MSKGKWAAAVCVTAGIATGAAAPAQASDATLRLGIIDALEVVKPAAEAFGTAAAQAEETGDLTALETATVQFRTGLRLYKWSVVNRKASSEEGLAAKRQLLDAVRQYDLGLVQFQKAYRQVEGSSSASALRSTLRTAMRRIDEAAEDEDEALAALKVDSGN